MPMPEGVPDHATVVQLPSCIRHVDVDWVNEKKHISTGRRVVATWETDGGVASMWWWDEEG